VIATAVIDDLVLYMVLAVALSMVSAGGTAHGLAALLAIDPASHWSAIVHVAATAAVIAATLLVGPYFWRSVGRVRRGAPADGAVLPHVVFLAIVSGSCWLLAVNPMFGALVGGMVAGQALRRSGGTRPRSLERTAGTFFVPLYFALVGARLDLVHHFDAVYFVAFLAFACVVKALSIYAGARASGEPHSAALNLAVALNARGGPGIVLAAVSFDAGIINENFYAILVLTAIVTSLAAGSWLGHVVRHGVPLRTQTPAWKPAGSTVPSNP
jgi:Kef-type K+ transport system membrane component KefB